MSRCWRRLWLAPITLGGLVTGMLAGCDSDGTSFEALNEHTARGRQPVFGADTDRQAQDNWSVQHLRIRRIGWR